MIIPDFSGGIGNQLFQLAFAFSLSQRTGQPLKLVSGRWLIGYNGAQGSTPAKYWDNLYRTFEKLDALPADVRVIKEIGWGFNAGLLAAADQQPANYVTSGYFQSGRYFAGLEDELRQRLQPAATEALPARWAGLIGPEDCFIGVRRGDYLKNRKIHCLCGPDYYRKAVDAMGPCQRYYVMSDDIAWCKRYLGEQILQGKDVVYIDETDDLACLAIMTQFSRYIIGNSTFHWWGSFLSVCQEPRIVAPDKWIDDGHPYDSIYRDGMIIVEREVDYET